MIAAAIGSHNTLLRIGISCSPNDPHEDDDADEEHQRVVAYVASLEEAQEITEAAHDESDHRGDPIDDRVHDLPQEPGTDLQRSDDRASVELVDVVLVLDGPRQSRRAALE